LPVLSNPLSDKEKQLQTHCPKGSWSGEGRREEAFAVQFPARHYKLLPLASSDGSEYPRRQRMA